MPGNYAIYHSRVEPTFVASAGRSPQDHHEVRRLMELDPYYQFWSAMQRRSQEMLWESVVDPTERELSTLVDRSRVLAARSRGSLHLDETLKVPRYHTAADIHLQPGGYHGEFTEDDVAAGAIYDAGINLYMNGALGPTNNAMGQLLTGFFKERYGARTPARNSRYGMRHRQ